MEHRRALLSMRPGDNIANSGAPKLRWGRMGAACYACSTCSTCSARGGYGGRYRAQRVPGLETDKRKEPTYFGLSLSVPTNERLVPLFLRPE